MDAKINRQRLSNLLSYDWLKILILIVTVIFAWTVLLSTLGTKPTMAQQIYFIYYEDMYQGKEGLTLDDRMITTDKKQGVFSKEVFESYSLVMSSNPSFGSMALSMRFAAGQYSIGFASDTAKNEDKTYLNEFLTTCYVLVEDMQEYLSDANAYFTALYNGDLTNGSLNEDLLQKDFYARAKKDKRYRTEKAKQKGLQDEKDRIEQTKNSFVAVQKALTDNIISLTETTLTDPKTKEPITKKFSVNIGSDKMANLSTLLYRKGEKDEQSANGINMVFFRMGKDEYNYMRFEKLNYLAYLLTNYAGKL